MYVVEFINRGNNKEIKTLRLKNMYFYGENIYVKSGEVLIPFQAFAMGAILVYLLYCWPYIVIAILYILFYSIKYRKTKLVKYFWIIAGGIILLILLSGRLIVINE